MSKKKKIGLSDQAANPKSFLNRIIFYIFCLERIQSNLGGDGWVPACLPGARIRRVQSEERRLQQGGWPPRLVHRSLHELAAGVPSRAVGKLRRNSAHSCLTVYARLRTQQCSKQEQSQSELALVQCGWAKGTLTPCHLGTKPHKPWVIICLVKCLF